jgi:hypothetical protein
MTPYRTCLNCGNNEKCKLINSYSTCWIPSHNSAVSVPSVDCFWKCKHYENLKKEQQSEREKVLKFAIERLDNLAEVLLGSQKSFIYCETIDAEIQRVKRELRQQGGRE